MPAAITPIIETTRLILRPLELADAARIQELFPHWEIVRYLTGGIPWPYPADGALSWCRDSALPAMARGEAWHWTPQDQPEPTDWPHQSLDEWRSRGR